MTLPSDSLASTQSALPISLIATPREKFLTCREDEEVVAASSRHADIDHLPVIAGDAGDERIVGLFDSHHYRDAPPGQLVRQHFSPLGEAHLIGADASILEFILAADVHSCRLLVSGTHVSGLVTLSDLQALPVRAALFAMITQLEMSLKEAIRREFPDGEEWMDRLTAGRQKKVKQLIAQSRADDAFVDALLFTQFCDKADIIRKSPTFEGGGFRADMKRAQALRDSLAHSNHYADTREEALQLCNTVRAINRWIEYFRSQSVA